MAIVPSYIGGEKINNAVTSFLDGGEVGIETIRRIDYGAQYLWTVDFIGNTNIKPPAPFNDFFPASDINFPSAVSNNHTFEMAQSSFSIPKNSAHRSIDITFYDDEKRSLERWMTDWIRLDLYNDGHFVSGIGDSHFLVDSKGVPNGETKDSFGVFRKVQPKRHIRIVFLDRFKNTTLEYNYDIIPNGEVIIVGSQNSESTVFNMKFDIVGKVASKDAKVGGNQLVNQIGKVLGRFI